MRTYPCILADPAWPFSDKGSRMTPSYSGNGRKRAHYKTMSLADIMAMPVEKLASQDAHLWLWCPNALVLDGSATKVARAWGFEPKQLIPWLKTDSNGKPRLGGGHYTRVCTEQLVLAVRGKAPPLWRGEPGIIIAERSRHSEKPIESYELIERISPAPRLELFARRRYGRWSIWGNELESVKAVEAILGKAQ